MVQVSIPEGVRPYLAGIVRYHFWILAALVPLILLPVLGMANTSLRGMIAAQQAQIDAKFSDLQGVTSESPHPNEMWSAAIDADTARIDAETHAEWQRLWHAQRGMRVWPQALGDDFLEAVAKLGPTGRLERPLLIRYQNMAPRLVRELPARMGVAMGDTEADPDKPQRPEAADPASASLPPLTWSADDQQKLYKSFDWPKVPVTTQVVMAQQELWVYAMFCDILKTFTRDATGAHDSPLTVVDRLAVGFPAIEAQPGGAGTKRLLVPELDPTAPGSEAPPDLPPEDMGGPEPEQSVAATPQHPRFGGPTQPATIEDDYRSWVYVDFSGRGLTAAQLAEAPPMFRLMPFVLRVVIDQRQLDRFLATLATWPIPIDVRQVRIASDENPVEPGSTAPVRVRPHDVTVELRGTVGLATPPDHKPADGQQPAAGEPAVPQAALPAGSRQRLREVAT
jgi:hypothetical protein